MLNVLSGRLPKLKTAVPSLNAVSCKGGMSESEDGVEGFRFHPSSSVHDLNEARALRGKTERKEGLCQEKENMT